MYWVFGRSDGREFGLTFSGAEGLLVSAHASARFSDAPDLLCRGRSELLFQIYRRIDRQYFAFDVIDLDSSEYFWLLELKSRLTVFNIDDFQQQPCTPATVLKRMEVIAAEGLGSGTDALLLGDDDLLTFLLERKGVRCTVVECAANVLWLLKGSGAAAIVEADITEVLDLGAKYWWVVMDPPYIGPARTAFFRLAERSLMREGILALSFAEYGLDQTVHRLLDSGYFDLIKTHPLMNVYLNPVTGDAEKNLSDFFLLKKRRDVTDDFWAREHSRSASFLPDVVLHKGCESVPFFLDDGWRGIHKFIRRPS